MRWISVLLATVIGVSLTTTITITAQSAPATASVTVPRLVRITGVFQPADGQRPAGVEIVTLSIYAEADGGLPVWQERQSVAVERNTGRFNLLLGASHPEGIPADVFGAGQAHWMSLLFERLGETEQPRVRIASVPYALKASDAETLGGLPASAYLRAPADDPARAGVAKGDPSLTSMEAPVTSDVVLPGTTNFLAKYVNGADVGNSAVYETPTSLVPTGAVGIGTTTPSDVLHLRFTNTLGQITGLAVQNMGNTNTSYSGMLFYDHLGALSQFQGFNNVTHEYRINNIARSSPGGPFNGSINFMVGGTSRFFVAPTGNIGIGTTSPNARLDVSNAIGGGQTGNIQASNFASNSFGSFMVTRKARGTEAAPSALQNGDELGFFGGRGYGATSFGQRTGGMSIRTTENWTDAAQGTGLEFSTTSNGSNTPSVKMTLGQSGRLTVSSMGVGTPTGDAAFEVVKSGTDGDAEIFVTSFDGPAQFLTRSARGTLAAPAAVQSSDALGLYGAGGYGATGFVQFRAGMLMLAAENWTDTAQGTALAFGSTPIGSSEPVFGMILLPSGNVGIGTATEIPTLTDKLEVHGDIRIGTTGTNGCIKNFSGAGIIGTCSSDRRFKKDITPFSSVLNQLAALQPVHYFWRAADFPQQHFGDSRVYGLIAQDVEDVLPELVVTNEDGFKAVDYTKLPLLTIQAVKELKAKNDALEQRVAENDALKERVEELERLVTEMIAAAARRQ